VGKKERRREGRKERKKERKVYSQALLSKPTIVILLCFFQIFPLQIRILL
jgi:hypothetical protein